MGKRVTRNREILERDFHVVEIDGALYQQQRNKLKLIQPFIHTTKHAYGKDLQYEYVALYNYATHTSHLLSYAHLLYAWFKGEVPAGYDIDHIDNNTLNNALDNLQLLTQEENLRKRPVSRNQYTSGKTDEEILAARATRRYVYDRNQHKLVKTDWWAKQLSEKEIKK